jgi:hypothetical protein
LKRIKSREGQEEVECPFDGIAEPEESQGDTFEDGCGHPSQIAQTHFADSDSDSDSDSNVNSDCEDMDKHSQTVTEIRLAF